MSANKKDGRKSLKTTSFIRKQVSGLDTFKLKIEKEFFCDVKISNQTTDLNNLIVEANFNFNLSFGLSLFANRKIGNVELNNEDFCLFSNAFENLKCDYNNCVDIKELSFVFEDCTLIIHRIYENSISNKLNDLLEQLSKNILYFTKGLSKVPFEIHVPVFEERIFNSDSDLLFLRMNEKRSEDYFGFWGLYFENQVEADIYDYLNKDIIDGELTMLNQ
jgi:hypothetical protein